jgi:hypothetical protein
MEQSPEVKGLEQGAAEEPVKMHVFMPKGMAMHILASIPRREQPSEETAANTQFCLEMEKLFHSLGTADIDAAVVLVKIREDHKVPRVDDQGQVVREAKTDYKGRAVEFDGQPVYEDVTDTVPGFSLGGGMTGPAEELMPMVMYLTESIQAAELQALAAKNPLPEGKTEEDRCPGCGGFHEKDGLNPPYTEEQVAVLNAEAASHVRS